MTRLYRQVASQIAWLIDTGEFNAPGRLPAERHLSARLSVSRPTIREAIVALELSGLVEVRAGSGVYVVNASAARTISIDLIDNAGASPIDVINARLNIECAIIGDAVKNVSDEQLKRIMDAHAQMEKFENRTDFQVADLEFHVTIAEATGNSVLSPIVEALWTEMSSPMFMRMGHISGLVGENEPWAIKEHQAICDAFKTKDPEAAQKAMKAHLLHVKEILQRDWNNSGTSGFDCLDAAE